LVPASVDIMAERILRLIDEPARRGSLGARAREASRRFSPDGAAEKLVGLYTSLLRAESPR
ncbi:MAG: hypothetical protein ACRDGM_03380, partial [bacterium]